MKTPLKQNVQIFSRIWRMMYIFITVKGATHPLKQPREKNFLFVTIIWCQTHVVEEKYENWIQINRESKVKNSREKSRMVYGIWEVKVGKVEDLHLYGPHVYSYKEGGELWIVPQEPTYTLRFEF